MKVDILQNGPILKYGVHSETVDSTCNSYVELYIKHTIHSFTRASQRGILGNKIIAALEYGEPIFKQGLIFYVLGKNNLPDSLQKDRKKLQNTVVVVASESNKVLTCYRSKNAFKNLKHKTKELYQNFISNNMDLKEFAA